MRLLNKFYLSPYVLILVLIGIIFKQIEELLFLFLLCFIHEMGHVIISKIFHCKTEKITFSVFGFSAEIEEVDYLKFYQQIIIYLAGPLTFFISWILLFFMKNVSLINLYQYQINMKNNLTLALFNLLPLYPLDGGRILDTINKKFFPVKDCLFYQRIWMIISLVPIVYFLFIEKQFLLLTIIMSLTIVNFCTRNYAYSLYLQKRIFIKNNFKKRVSFEGEIYHFNNNFYLREDKLINEKEVLPSMILKNTKKKKSII